MFKVSFINPLSSESQEIVREKGNLDNVFKENEDLINTIFKIPSQKISDETLIPKNLGQLAIKRIKWYIERKYNKNFNLSDYEYLLSPEITDYDVLVFHLLSQAIAMKFNLTSRETRLFIESEATLVEERLAKIPPSSRGEILDKSLSELTDNVDINWKSLKDLIASKKLSLTEIVIDNGEIVLEKEDFLEKFGDEFKDRSPDRMYEILIGDKVKELILSRIIMQRTEDYIKKIKDMSYAVEIHPSIEKIGENLAQMIPEEINSYSSFYGSGGGGLLGSMKIGKLIREAFPPCISNTMNGVSSGGRNDAIVLLLTSFLSYARLYPQIFASDEVMKISDIDKNLSITQNEILPLIYEAADNCSPPLFSDQPQEKLNIISKLGFGLNDEVHIENEGDTIWYTPMSCEKIKIHLPQLCRPDKDCKNINNPLSCYARKRSKIKEDNEE
ncbi:DNA primase large subunit PriL [Methanobrevibacter sp. DSM 116169]|uniref:DNA primase large subunit PriL n=1 Tax=Methanobrevibacter sp. DSM 116169 TaxID=3242727 RepID=UPI0038FCD344